MKSLSLMDEKIHNKMSKNCAKLTLKAMQRFFVIQKTCAINIKNTKFTQKNCK